jgi:hypothetical protein
MDRLTFQEKHRKVSQNETSVDFQDFYVNEKSLLEVIPNQDLVGVIGSFKPEFDIEAVSQLLLKEKSELSSGRVPIYVCPECGDLGCGAITISIQENEETYIWKDFGFENNYDEELLAEYNEIGPFTFSKIEYESKLKQFV